MNLNKVNSVLRQTPNLKRLALVLGNITCPFQALSPSTEMETTVVDHPLFRFPQLEILTISFRWTSPFSRKFLYEILTMGPNLRVLVMADCFLLEESQKDVVLDMMLEALKKLSLKGVVLTPNGLPGGVPIYGAVARTQQLKSLGISLQSGAAQTWEVVEAQQDLLESQADHLENLYLFNGWFEPGENNENVPKLRLPVFKKLRSLSVNFYQLYAERLDPEHVPFNIQPLTPRHVPNLRKLNLYTPYLGLGILADCSFRTVTQLVLQNWGYYPGALLLVASRFPKLKKLQNLGILNLSSSDTALMGSSWPDMEDLTLTLRSDRPQTDFNLVLSGAKAEWDWRRCEEGRVQGSFLLQFKSKFNLIFFQIQ